MRRSVALVLTAATFAAVAGVQTGATAAHQCSIPSGNNIVLGFKYCGEHWAAGEFPIKFKVNLSSRPSSLSEARVLAAVQGAISEWNRYWPLPAEGDLIECQGSLLCLGGTTGVTSAARDGTNAIFFGAGSVGCGDGSEVAGYACLWYSPTNPHRITEVDVVLNPSMSWMQPATTDAAYIRGEALGDTTPDAGGLFEDRIDLQSVLTHELGHAVGLEHIGSPSKWPARPHEDAWSFQQTMYRYSFDGTTNKRTLLWGDIAGLTAIAYHLRTGLRIDVI